MPGPSTHKTLMAPPLPRLPPVIKTEKPDDDDEVTILSSTVESESERRKRKKGIVRKLARVVTTTVRAIKAAEPPNSVTKMTVLTAVGMALCRMRIFRSIPVNPKLLPIANAKRGATKRRKPAPNNSNLPIANFCRKPYLRPADEELNIKNRTTIMLLSNIWVGLIGNHG